MILWNPPTPPDPGIEVLGVKVSNTLICWGIIVGVLLIAAAFCMADPGFWRVM